MSEDRLKTAYAAIPEWQTLKYQLEAPAGCPAAASEIEIDYGPTRKIKLRRLPILSSNQPDASATPSRPDTE